MHVPVKFESCFSFLENIEIKEAKEVFEYHYSHIYHVFFDSFVALESSFKLG